MKTSRCRSPRCGASVIWAEHEETGKRSPYDASPIERVDQETRTSLSGLYELIARPGNVPLARRATTARGANLHESHFATCPDAERFRKARR